MTDPVDISHIEEGVLKVLLCKELNEISNPPEHPVTHGIMLSNLIITLKSPKVVDNVIRPIVGGSHQVENTFRATKDKDDVEKCVRSLSKKGLIESVETGEDECLHLTKKGVDEMLAREWTSPHFPAMATYYQKRAATKWAITEESTPEAPEAAFEENEPNQKMERAGAFVLAIAEKNSAHVDMMRSRHETRENLLQEIGLKPRPSPTLPEIKEAFSRLRAEKYIEFKPMRGTDRLCLTKKGEVALKNIRSGKLSGIDWESKVKTHASAELKNSGANKKAERAFAAAENNSVGATLTSDQPLLHDSPSMQFLRGLNQKEGPGRK